MDNEEIIKVLEARVSASASSPEFRTVYVGVTEDQVDTSLIYLGPWTLEFAYEKMTTGSLLAQDWARAEFSAVVNSAAALISDEDMDPDWDRTVPSSSEIKSSLWNVWTLVSLIEEIGKPVTQDQIRPLKTFSRFANTAYAAILHIETGKTPDYNENHWRGIAALTLSEQVTNYAQELPEHAMAFVDWVGERPDIVSVLQVARERGVLHPETIEGLLNQTEVKEVLRSGLL